MKLEFINNNQFFEISEKHGVYFYNDEMLAKLVELAEHLNKFFKFIENEI